MKNKTHRHNHDHGILSMDRFAQNSSLKDINPTLKLGISVASLFYCIAINSNLIPLIIAIIMTSATIIAAKTPVSYYFSLMKFPIIFIVISFLTLVINFPKEAMGVFNLKLFNFYLCITKEGLFEGMRVTIKAYSAVTCLYFINLTTPIQDIIEVLKKLHVPNIVIELMYLIYRYIFLLMDVQHKMTISAMSRLGYMDRKNSWYTFSHISGNVIVNSFRRSSSSYDAMESRCYDGEISFLTREKKVKGSHIIIAILYIAVIFICTFILKTREIDLF